MTAIDDVKIQPKFGRVLIKRDVKDRSSGGIIIPNAKKHAACEGIIIALGETAGWAEVPDKGHLQTLHLGDRVIFGRHAGTWLDETHTPVVDRQRGISGLKPNDDGTLFMCQDADILAVIKDEQSTQTMRVA